jgi:Na+/melibiose symporter-like transporter
MGLARVRVTGRTPSVSFVHGWIVDAIVTWFAVGVVERIAGARRPWVVWAMLVAGILLIALLLRVFA